MPPRRKTGGTLCDRNGTRDRAHNIAHHLGGGPNASHSASTVVVENDDMSRNPVHGSKTPLNLPYLGNRHAVSPSDGELQAVSASEFDNPSPGSQGTPTRTDDEIANPNLAVRVGEIPALDRPWYDVLDPEPSFVTRLVTHGGAEGVGSLKQHNNAKDTIPSPFCSAAFFGGSPTASVLGNVAAHADFVVHLRDNRSLVGKMTYFDASEHAHVVDAVPVMLSRRATADPRHLLREQPLPGVASARDPRSIFAAGPGGKTCSNVVAELSHRVAG